MRRIVMIVSLFACGSVFANDVDPMGFEKEHFLSSLTRAEAIAASKAPLTIGMDTDIQGRTVRTPSTLTRAQVEAETREAARLGLIRYGEGDPVFGGVAREEQVELAGHRATASGRAQ